MTMFDRFTQQSNAPKPSGKELQAQLFAGFLDSIGDLNADASRNPYFTEGWSPSSLINQMAAQSGGRLRMIKQGAVPGENSTQVLARARAYFASLTPTSRRPDIFFFSEQINDHGQGVPFAVTMANHIAAVELARANGVRTIMIGLATPTKSFDYRNQNYQMKLAMEKLGAITADPMPALAGPDGLLLDQYNRDGTHPTDEGYARLARAYNAQLLPNGGDLGYVATTTADAMNLSVNPLFDGVAGALPTGYKDAGLPNAPVVTYDLKPAPAGYAGNKFVINKTDPTNAQKDVYTTIATGLIPGHRYEIQLGFELKCVTPGLTASAIYSWRDGSDKIVPRGSNADQVAPILQWSTNASASLAHIEAIAPATAAGLRLELLVGGAGTGPFSVYVSSLRDLTALGLSS